MKLSDKEQERLDYIRSICEQYGTCGGGNFENPKDQTDKRTRKLYDLGLILSVGVGQRTKDGWTGGGGVIPADMFDPSKHTKLSLENELNLEVETVAAKNSLGMDIAISYVKLDGITIAECRDQYWANFLANAIKKERT